MVSTGGSAASPSTMHDAHVDARDVALDERAVGVLREQLVEHAAERDRVLDHALLADALARALEVRLRDHREGQLVEAAARQRGSRDEAPARAGHAAAGELLLRERLVERDA